jgi:hypothetical protein
VTPAELERVLAALRRAQTADQPAWVRRRRMALHERRRRELGALARRPDDAQLARLAGITADRIDALASEWYVR